MIERTYGSFEDILRLNGTIRLLIKMRCLTSEKETGGSFIAIRTRSKIRGFRKLGRCGAPLTSSLLAVTSRGRSEGITLLEVRMRVDAVPYPLCFVGYIKRQGALGRLRVPYHYARYKVNGQ